MISAFNALECAVVIEAKKGEAGGRELDLLLHRSRIDIIPLNEKQGKLALSAWRRFGKGNHPAGLNIGDCCAYALIWAAIFDFRVIIQTQLIFPARSPHPFGK
jgi:ribonuclease VapC